MKLPEYQSHKVVEAGKILSIARATATLVVDTGPDTAADVKVGHDWLERHNPKIGGYYVRYSDGYDSFSPATAFEEGYSRLYQPGEIELVKEIESDDPEDALITRDELKARLEAQTAPKVTPESIKARIADIDWIHTPGSTLTLCVATMENGFIVVGKSACASPENYNAEIGERIAYEDVVDQLFTLEGYLLRERLHNMQLLGAAFAEGRAPVSAS